MVTVEGAEETEVQIVTVIYLESGLVWDDVKQDVRNKIQDYYTELSKTWQDKEYLVVRISQIESRILEIDGIIDVSGTILNLSPDNLILDPNNIPVWGAIFPNVH